MLIAGVIFNGGKASRLGGIDKGAIEVDGQSSFARTVSAMAGIDDVFVSVAADCAGETYQTYGVIKDNPNLLPAEARPPGVILSVLTALEFTVAAGYDAMITAPVDTPYLPGDFVQRLSGRTLKTAVTTGQIHGLHAFWPAQALPEIKNLVAHDGLRKVSKLHEILGSEHCEFTRDEMRNLNTPDDLK